MNKKILQQNIQEYIQQKCEEKVDITKLILSGSPFEGISSKELAQQISGKNKAKKKLPLWYDTPGIYFPPTINLEQTSSEQTAMYKSNLVSGMLLIDITGGFGVDSFYFSKRIKRVIHCEVDPNLGKLAAHNFKTLGADTIETRIGDGLEILKEFESVDWIYMDPSRRNQTKGKVFFLEDCIPNVPDNLDHFFGKSDQILIKTSPLLDISSGIKSLQDIEEIHIVAIQNEVKELLWLLRKNTNNKIAIHTMNIKSNTTETFSFDPDKETVITPRFSDPKKFLYEPNAAIMKSGGFSSLGHHYQLGKLHMHSHLYTSDMLLDFPGRIFEIDSALPFSKKISKKLAISKANITTRNFPITVSEIRKMLKIKEGGEEFLFFTTNYKNEKIVIHCKKKR